MIITRLQQPMLRDNTKRIVLKEGKELQVTRWGSAISACCVYISNLVSHNVKSAPAANLAGGRKLILTSLVTSELRAGVAPSCGGVSSQPYPTPAHQCNVPCGGGSSQCFTKENTSQDSLQCANPICTGTVRV